MLKLTVALMFTLSFYSTWHYNDAILFKLTNLHCESFNKSVALVNACHLKPFKRDITNLFINITLFEKFNKIDLLIEWTKRTNNGLKPFLYNLSVDFCAYMRKKNNPILNLIHEQIRNYSNINHTCPYYGDVIVKDFHPFGDMLFRSLPLPNGEYCLKLTWTTKKVKLFVTDVSFDFNAGIHN